MHKPELIGGGTSLEQIAQLMMETQQDHVFVLDKEEKLIGVVSGIDVVKKIIELLSIIKVDSKTANRCICHITNVVQTALTSFTSKRCLLLTASLLSFSFLQEKKIILHKTPQIRRNYDTAFCK